MIMIKPHPEKSLLWSKEQRTPRKANKTNEKGRWLDLSHKEAMETGGKLFSNWKLVRFSTFPSTTELFPSPLYHGLFICQPPPRCTAHTRPAVHMSTSLQIETHLLFPVPEKQQSTKSPTRASEMSSPCLWECPYVSHWYSFGGIFTLNYWPICL